MATPSLNRLSPAILASSVGAHWRASGCPGPRPDRSARSARRTPGTGSAEGRWPSGSAASHSRTPVGMSRARCPDVAMSAIAPATAGKRLQVDMERAGEQQEREHPLHQGFGEVDLRHRIAHGRPQAKRRAPARRRPSTASEIAMRDDHQADGMGQAQKLVIDVAKAPRRGRSPRRRCRRRHPSLDPENEPGRTLVEVRPGKVSRMPASDHYWKVISTRRLFGSRTPSPVSTIGSASPNQRTSMIDWLTPLLSEIGRNVVGALLGQLDVVCGRTRGVRVTGHRDGRGALLLSLGRDVIQEALGERRQRRNVPAEVDDELGRLVSSSMTTGSAGARLRMSSMAVR